MKGKVKCTCGWSWNKSDSSKKDMYICHECGRDNSNNMKNGGWLDSYDKAQDGKDVNLSQNEISFAKDYMSSPAYYDMLKKSSEKSGEDMNMLSAMRNINLKNTSVVFPEKNTSSTPGATAESNSDTGEINVYPEAVNSPFLKGIIQHEISHSVDRPIYPGGERVIPKSDIDLISKYSNIDKNFLFTSPEFKDAKYDALRNNYRYISEPTETRARLNDIRYNAKSSKLYDPFTEKVTPEILKKIKNSKTTDAFDDLNSIYNDDQIIDLLNSVSQNKQFQKESFVAKNGGWLDSYADGGTMQEHQENYNDYKVSAPEGFKGTGYSNVGRNYSPAWGGQFEEGGEIPMAQDGKATRADSLAVYNNAKKVEDYYKSKNYKLEKQDAFVSNNDPSRLKKILSDDESRFTKKQYNETSTGYDNILYFPSKRKIIKNNKESFIDSANPKNKEVLKKIYNKKIDDNKLIQREGANRILNLDSPSQYFDLRIQPQSMSSYKDVSKNTLTSNDKVDIIKYDPLAVKPFDLLTDAEKKLRVEKYGTDGVPKSYLNKNKPTTTKETTKPSNTGWLPLTKEIAKGRYEGDLKNMVYRKKADGSYDITYQAPPEVSRKTVQPLIPLQPIGIQNDFNIEASIPVIRPQAIMPKSFDVTSQRQTMSGPSEYYNYSNEGVDISDAVRVKESADAYNQYVKEKYEEAAKTNPKAKKRIDELMQNTELTPNYQMGGSVYPVNYVPKAQWGLPIAGKIAEKIGGWFDDEPVKKPVAKKKSNDRTLNIVDPRKKMVTNNQPLRPNVDLLNGKFDSHHLDKLIQEAKRQGLSKKDIMNLSAMGFQETKWGRTDPNIGHVLHNGLDQGSFNQYEDFVDAYKAKMKEADRLGITDPVMRLQVYNGMGTITPKTEKDYHGFEMQKIYGVPIPKGGISMRKNPLYGKQVTDVRDNVLAKNPEYMKYMDSIYAAPLPDYMKQQAHEDKLKVPLLIDKGGSGARGSFPKTKGFAPLVAPKLAPLKKNAMGGTIAGAPGFSYARTIDPAPSEGPYAKKTMPSAKDGGWLDGYDKAQEGTKVEYGTPEYEKAYNRGEVVTDEGGRSPILLDEVVVQNNYKRNFWEKYRDKIIEENKDASPLGAIIGAPISAITSLPQLAMMNALTGKMQRPSEAMNIQNPYGAFAVDAVADPANLIGAGILTKEGAISKLGNLKIPKFKSEINWGKWNKEIPENPQLIKEYNVIEQTSKANGSWMKNPDGSAFQGTPEQFVQQNSENFKKAFGNTKVRDPKGNVQITNHSTWDKFDEFDLNKFGQTDDGFYGKGVYFHPNTNSQGLYGDINMNSYVNIENPMPHETRSFFGREGKGSYWDSSKNEQVIIDDLGSLWKGKYDGYITPHGEYPLNDFNSTEYITNIPSNIKSATGNNGMFDMTNPNIYKAIVPGAIGVGAASQIEQKKEGGVIKDDRGQWDHPGEITRISGGKITMKKDPKTGKALTQPILGIADTGEEQWMYPGEDYNFEGANYVTEYPKGKKPRMAKNGLRQEQKGLVNLDNLLNFTNYNTKQPGGWLDTL